MSSFLQNTTNAPSGNAAAPSSVDARLDASSDPSAPSNDISQADSSLEMVDRVSPDTIGRDDTIEPVLSESDQDASEPPDMQPQAPNETPKIAFPTYAEYIRAIRKNWPQYENLYKVLTAESNIQRGAYRILIADCSKTDINVNTSATNISRLRLLAGGPPLSQHYPVPIDHILNTEVIEQITSAPEQDLETRVISLEFLYRVQDTSREIVDAIGRSFNIDPAVFDAFFSRNSWLSRNDDGWVTRSSIRRPMPRMANFVRFHGFMVGFVKEVNHLPTGRKFNLVLVLSYLTQWQPDTHGLLFDRPPSIMLSAHLPPPQPIQKDFYEGRTNPEIHGLVFGRPPVMPPKTQSPISQSSIATPQYYNGDNPRPSFFSHSRTYADWLSSLTRPPGADLLDFCNQHPLEFIYPIIEYYMHDLVAKTYLLRKRLAARSEYFANYENTGYENDEDLLNHVFADADSMKEILSDADETRRLILRNIDIASTSTHRGAVPLLKYMDETITDAKELLTLIAEAQNRMIAHLQIEESRRSIQEAASVKRLTLLAFIFIPLSYVSSLFGMNISELNGTGPKLWKFLATSFCILLGALAFWDLATRIQGRWAVWMEDRRPHEGSWRKVCGIVYAGIRTGHFWWMVRSGVLVGLGTWNRFGDAKDTVEKCEGRFYRAWSEEKWRRQSEKLNLERERRER